MSLKTSSIGDECMVGCRKEFNEPIVIIGGGLTGLGAAYLMDNCGFSDWMLFESQDSFGGLSRSFEDEKGYFWDVGGHVVFSHYDSFSEILDKLFDSTGWLCHQRESWIRMMNSWIPYPFQNNIHRLPPELATNCLVGLIDATLNKPEAFDVDFEDFIVKTFGKGIADLFMRPYNFKVWAYPATEMDAHWVGDRVSVPDIKRVARNFANRKDDISWGPNSAFRFPRFGGTGAIVKALVARLPSANLKLKHDVIDVDFEKKIIHFSNGTSQTYSYLISTIPLDVLIGFSDDTKLREIAKRLTHSSVNVVGLALAGAPGKELESKCWMYFPDLATPFYRVTHFSLYSPNNVPAIGKCWSLMAEVSESPGKKVDHSNLVQDVVDGLIYEGIISERNELTHHWVYRAEYGYPTPFKGRDEILHKLLIHLEQLDVLSRGRFGAWFYEIGNMDHSFMQGLEAASRLLFGCPEFTLWNPHVVNQPHPVLGWSRLKWRLKT